MPRGRPSYVHSFPPLIGAPPLKKNIHSFRLTNVTVGVAVRIGTAVVTAVGKAVGTAVGTTVQYFGAVGTARKNFGRNHMLFG